MLRITALHYYLLLLFFIGSSSIAIATENPTTLETALRGVIEETTLIDLIEQTEEPMNSSLNPTFSPSVNSTTSTSIEQSIETSSSNFQGRSVTPVNGDSQHEVLAGLQSPQQNTDNNQSSLLPTIFKQKYIFGSDLLPMQIGKEGELKKMKDSYAAQQELAKTSSPELFEAYESACAILGIAESYQTKALLKASEKYQELSTKEQSITKSVFFLRDLHCSDGQGEILNRNITKLLSAANSVVELTKERIRVDQLIASARAVNGIPGREESINNFETVMQQTRNAIDAYKAFANAVEAGSTEEARLMFEHGSNFKSSAHDQKISFLTTEAATFKNHYNMLSAQARTAGNIAQATTFKEVANHAYTTERGLQKALTDRAEGDEKVTQASELLAQCWMQVAWACAEGTETGLERANIFKEAAKHASDARTNFKGVLTARAKGHEEVAQASELSAQYYMQAAWARAEGTETGLEKANIFKETARHASDAQANFEEVLTARAEGHKEVAQACELAAQYYMQAAWARTEGTETGLERAKNFKKVAIDAYQASVMFMAALTARAAEDHEEVAQACELAAQYYMQAAWAHAEGTMASLARAMSFRQAAIWAYSAEDIFKKTLPMRAIGHAKAAQSGEFSARCLIQVSQIFARKAPEDFPTFKDIGEFFSDCGFATAANYQQAVELVLARGSDDQIEALLQAGQYRSLATQAYVQGDKENLLKAKELKQGAIIAHKAATIFGEAYKLSQQSNNSNESQVKSLTDKAKSMLEEAHTRVEQVK